MNKKKILRWLLSGFLLVVLASAFLFFPTWTQPNARSEKGIYELKKVTINDVLLQVMIRGTSASNPVILFVSDGFDPTFSYVREYEETLEQYATIVHFDLRGTGRSELGQWDENETYLSKLVDDVLQLSIYLQREFAVDQIILLGHGTGSIIAREALLLSPQLYSTYIGISQINDLFDNDLAALQQLKNWNHDLESLTAIEEKITKKEGFLDRKMIEEYKSSSLQWNKKLSEVRGLLFRSETNGWDYLKAKSKESGLWELFYEAYIEYYDNLNHHNTQEQEVDDAVTDKEIKVPMYFVSGRYDYLVPKDESFSYYENLEAREKFWVEFTSSAHYPHIEEAAKFVELIREITKNDKKSTENHE